MDIQEVTKMENTLSCPRCGSVRLNKTGYNRYGDKITPRYYCRGCYHITIKPVVKSETEAKLLEGKAPVSRNNINGISQC